MNANAAPCLIGVKPCIKCNDNSFASSCQCGVFIFSQCPSKCQRKIVNVVFYYLKYVFPLTVSALQIGAICISLSDSVAVI